MIARVLAVALAAVAVVVAVHALRVDHRCAALQNAGGHARRSEMATFARQAAERCNTAAP